MAKSIPQPTMTTPKTIKTTPAQVVKKAMEEPKSIGTVYTKDGGKSFYIETTDYSGKKPVSTQAPIKILKGK